MKSISKIAPYNRCDYRCESCVHIRDCRLFNKGIGEQLNSAQSPDDIDPVLTNIHKTIFETIRMLQEKANELGINLAKTENVKPNLKSISNAIVNIQDFKINMGKMIKNKSVWPQNGEATEIN